MTLEDFFTVTEMKDGLTASARVKELVNSMLDERNSIVKNVGDAAKQWSTVASTIAATKDKDCVDLFIQLDGMSFISKWLEDAQSLGNEPSYNSAEGSITALLHAVEKLHINYEQSMAFGIQTTVEKLLSHSSIKVQEKARILFDSWKQLVAGEVITSLGGEGGQTLSSAGDSQPTIVVTREEKHFKAGVDMVLHMCSNHVLPVKIDDIETRTDNEVKHLPYENVKDEDSIVKKPFEESLCNEGKNQSNHLDGNASSRTSTAIVREEDMMVSNQLIGNEEQMQVVASPSDRSGAMEISQTQGGDCNTNILVGSGNEGRSPKPVKPNTSSLRVDSDSTSSEHRSSESGDLTNVTDFWKTKTKGDDVVNRSDFELDYGMVDALEIACQVANEVEREVEGQRERSCGSSPKNLENEIRQPDSPAAGHGSEAQTDESELGEDLRKEEISNKQNDPNVNSSLIPDCGQEPESKPDKGIIDFDLNQEICSNDTNHPLDSVSTPISIVSASRAAAMPGFPASPLQFEGALGWKGTAATSAFRPASLHKVHDGNKIDNNLKHRQDFLDFDLNMSEEGEDKAADLLSRKQILHSGESSGETRLNLDLNAISDGGDAPPSGWRLSERLLLGRNGHHNASPSSSSSSMPQPLRNFDLNDQPSFFNDYSELNSFAKLSSSQKLHSSIGPRSTDSVISIMGTKVAVNRKDFFPQTPSLPNGKILVPALDVNLTRNGGVLGIGSAVPYLHPGMFTYNGLTAGTTGTFAPIMYGPGGPIHYMVDSRGAPVMPQFMGSASAASAPYSQTPFAAPGVYGIHPPVLSGSGPGPSRPNFELNLGFMGETANRESGGLRQFLGPGPSRPVDELRSSFQPSSPFVLGKRKEPDGGWEPYPFDYKHHYPHWK